MTNKNSVSAPVNGVLVKRDLYQEVTDTIMGHLEKGVALWHMPWVTDFNPFQIPKNIVSNKGYNGVNILLLWGATINKDLRSHDWATFKQWGEKHGERIRKGEKGTMIVYYDTFEKEKDGEIEKIPFLKSSIVFNRCQLENYKADNATFQELPNQATSIEKVDSFVKKTTAKVIIGGDRACYFENKDEIHMPETARFFDTEHSTATTHYYAALLHELGHWTGHKDRLNRDFTGRFGSKSYAFEELVAELTAAFLTAELNITNQTSEDHSSYLANWLELMKEDKRAILTAASAASKAVDYLKKLQTIHL